MRWARGFGPALAAITGPFRFSLGGPDSFPDAGPHSEPTSQTRTSGRPRLSNQMVRPQVRTSEDQQRNQLIRFQVVPPQNIPPRAQPWTLS